MTNSYRLAGLLGAACVALTVMVRADGDRPPVPAVPQVLSPLEGMRVYPEDDPLTTFEPREPQSAQGQRKRSALSWYMLGMLHQSRDEFGKALPAFLNSVESDPAAIDGYRGAIPLLLKDRKDEQAQELALRAARNSEQGVELVQTMAAVYIRDNRPEEAIGLLKSALTLPTIQPNSVSALALHRDLGLFYRLDEEFERAADEYELVFNALVGGGLSKSDWESVVRDPGAMFDELGDTFLKAEQPALALKAYEEASKYRETNPALHGFNLATVFRQNGQAEKALEELNRYFAAQLQSRGRQAYQLLKDLLHDLGKDDELFARLEQLHKDDPHNETLTYFYADQLVLADRLDEAEKTYLGGEGAPNRNNPQAIVGMLSVYRRRGDIKELMDTLTKAYPLIPRADRAGVLANLADDVKALAEHFEEELTAIKESDETMKGLCEFVRSQAKGEDLQAEFVRAYIIGKLAAEAVRVDEAVEFYQLAISMQNEPNESLYWELGSFLVDADAYEKAIEVLNQALAHPASSLQGAHWKFQFLLSYAYEYLGKTDLALEVVRQAQQGRPDLALMYYQEGWVVYHRQRWDEALKLFQGVIEKFPGDKKMQLDCQFLISNIYVKQGDMPKGEQVLLDVLKENPDHPQANNDLGYLWADQNKNLAEAKKMITKALELEPDNAAYQDSMGWILYREGDFEGSLKFLEKATKEKKGEDSTLFEHLGDCYGKLDRAEDAQAAYRKAMELETKKELVDQDLIKRLQEKLVDAPK